MVSTSRLASTSPRSLSLFGYQRRGAKWLRQIRRGILADEPGLGKSAQALTAAEGRTLIIAPAMMYESGDWQHELDLWRPDLDVTMTTFGLVNYRYSEWNGAKQKMTSRVSPKLREELRGHWDTLIVDEAHHLKGWPLVNWSEAITRIDADRVYLLTGTPIPNWSYEILPLLRLLMPGDRRFSNRQNWIDEWFDTRPSRWGGAWSVEVMGLKPGLSGGACACQIDPLTHRVKSCTACWRFFRQANSIEERMLRRTWPEVGIELPPKREETLLVPMSPRQRAIYQTLKKDYLAQIEETGTEVVAWSVGGLHTKLARLSTGIESLDDNWPAGKRTGKFKRLEEILADREGSGVLVFTQFRNSAELAYQIAAGLGRKPGLIMGGVTGRGQIKQAFQAGFLDTLVGTIESMSESIQLQRANTVIFLEHSWRPSMNEQGIRRAWRMGQTQNVLVLHLVTADSVDERMQAVLAEKTDDQIAMLTAGEFAHLL